MYSYNTNKLIERNEWTSQSGSELLESILQKLRKYPLGQYYLRTYTIYTRAFIEVLEHEKTLISKNSKAVALELLKDTITFASGIKKPVI